MSFEALRRAAEEGQADAQYRLAVAYLNGDELPHDAAQGREWCRRASEQGHAQARFVLDALNSKRDPKLQQRNPAKAPPRRLPAGAEVAEEPLGFVDKAPCLTTINGCGFKLYGKSAYDEATDSFLTTHYLTFGFVPLVPITRYRVIRDGSHYQFLGKTSFRTFEKVHLALFIIGLIWFVLASRH